MVHIVTTGPYSFKDLLSHMRTHVKSTHRHSFYIRVSRQPGNLLHFEDELHNLCHIFRKIPFLVTFVKLRKAIISFMSVRQSASNSSLWTDFHEILYSSIFLKAVEKNQFSLKSDNLAQFFL